MTSRRTRAALLTIPLFMGVAGCGDLFGDPPPDCGGFDTCGAARQLSFVYLDPDPVLGSDPDRVPPIAVGGTADIGVLALSAVAAQPEYVMEARVEPEDRFSIQIADDGTYLSVTALGEGTGELHVLTRSGEEDVLVLEATEPVHYEVRLSTPPMLAVLEAWENDDLDEVPFTYTPGTELHATLEVQGPREQRLGGFGLATWSIIDAALATTSEVERTDAIHLAISEELLEGDLLVLEAGDQATRIVPIELPEAVASIEWERLQGSLPDEIALDLGEPLDLFVTARDERDQVMVPSAAHRLELESDPPGPFTVDHHDLRDYITVEAIEPGTYDVGLRYLGQQRQIQLVVAGG